MLCWVCKNINNIKIPHIEKKLLKYPSIIFGIEQAILNVKYNYFIIFPSNFTKQNSGIKINGLINRGSIYYMNKSLLEKKKLGFKYIKVKIGHNFFEEEYKLIKYFIKKNPSIKISVDANSLFSIKDSLEKIYKLYSIGVKLIEQPIKKNQWEYMNELCQKSPIPIALDEELSGIFSLKKKNYY